MQAQCPDFPPFAADPDQFPDLLNVSQVSCICGLSVASIRAYLRKNKFPEPIRFTARKVFWRKADVLEFLSGASHE